MFKIKNISRKYGDEFALQNVSLEITGGMNFIIGPSGSGKSTLLKILSGMDKGYTGEAYYNDTNIRTLKEGERAKLYASQFGFISQNFNLIDNMTVLENVMLPIYLQEKNNKEHAIKILKQLKIDKFTNQKVATLSGGQKQRVAIARELIKNPEILFADEPTAALDKKTAHEIVTVLKSIARTRTVIVVTHDTSLIDNNSRVFQLDKGELDKVSGVEKKDKKLIMQQTKTKLSAGKAVISSFVNLKSGIVKSIAVMMSIVIAAVFLLIGTSGILQDHNDEIFNELYERYGTYLVTVQLVSGITSGTGGDTANNPKTDIEQDISALYDKYKNDSRVEYAIYTQPINDINITLNHEDYAITGTNSMPYLKEIVSGELPYGEGMEVVVPKTFADQAGLSYDEIIGKEIDFNGQVYSWATGEPQKKPINLTLTIVGVADTTVIYGEEGEHKRELEDSFYFSKKAIDEIVRQANKDKKPGFVLIGKSPEDTVSLADEISKTGIVPIGGFELIKDMVDLNKISSNQTNSASNVIAVFSVVIALSVSLITAGLRKKEYAIYKISGYKKFDLGKVIFSQYGFIFIIGFGVFVLTLPVINILTEDFLGATINSFNMIKTGGMLMLAISSLCAISTYIISCAVKAEDCLKSEDR